MRLFTDQLTAMIRVLLEPQQPLHSAVLTQLLLQRPFHSQLSQNS